MPSPSPKRGRPSSQHPTALSPDFRKILISRKQVSRLLGVSDRTVDHLVTSGRLPSQKIGDRRMFSLATLFAFAEGG
jgi:excisionase family DNA binding protein